ncbi:hypothetical protein ACJX0J_021812, partial [Zea mays]
VPTTAVPNLHYTSDSGFNINTLAEAYLDDRDIIGLFIHLLLGHVFCINKGIIMKRKEAEKKLQFRFAVTPTFHGQVVLSIEEEEMQKKHTTKAENRNYSKKMHILIR